MAFLGLCSAPPIRPPTDDELADMAKQYAQFVGRVWHLGPVQHPTTATGVMIAKPSGGLASCATPDADPDGPLVPLPERQPPVRVVPPFPLTAYLALLARP